MMNTVAPTARRQLRRSISSWRATDSIWQVVLRAFGTALVITALVVTLVVALLPRALGGDTLTVLSGSMEPTFSAGDAVAVRAIEPDQVCNDVSVGEIITFFPEANDPTLITHRVVGKTLGSFDDGSSCRLVTQGDANSAVDAPVSPEQVRGAVMFSVPKLGFVREWVVQNPVSLAIGAGVVLLIWGAVGSLRRPRTRIITTGGSAPAAHHSAGVGPSAPLASPSVSGATEGKVNPAESQANANSDRDREYELLQRELRLWEREVDILERELQLSRKSVPAQPSQKEGASLS